VTSTRPSPRRAAGGLRHRVSIRIALPTASIDHSCAARHSPPSWYPLGSDGRSTFTTTRTDAGRHRLHRLLHDLRPGAYYVPLTAHPSARTRQNADGRRGLVSPVLRYWRYRSRHHRGIPADQRARDGSRCAWRLGASHAPGPAHSAGLPSLFPFRPSLRGLGPDFARTRRGLQPLGRAARINRWSWWPHRMGTPTLEERDGSFALPLPRLHRHPRVRRVWAANPTPLRRRLPAVEDQHLSGVNGDCLDACPIGPTLRRDGTVWELDHVARLALTTTATHFAASWHHTGVGGSGWSNFGRIATTAGVGVGATPRTARRRNDEDARHAAHVLACLPRSKASARAGAIATTMPTPSRRTARHGPGRRQLLSARPWLTASSSIPVQITGLTIRIDLHRGRSSGWLRGTEPTARMDMGLELADCTADWTRTLRPADARRPQSIFRRVGVSAVPDGTVKHIQLPRPIASPVGHQPVCGFAATTRSRPCARRTVWIHGAGDSH